MKRLIVAACCLLLSLPACNGKGASDSMDSEDYNNRGVEWNDKGEFDKAIEDFDEAIRLDPNLAPAYSNRGNAWYSKGELDKAIADYSVAIRLDPKFAMVYYNRGNVLHKKGEFDKAIEDFDEAIRLHPKFVSAYFNRGTAWDKKGEPDKAIADYSEAIKLDPQKASAYSNRGNMWNNKGQYDKAIRDYNEAVRLNPKEAFAFNGLAWLQATCSNPSYRDGKRAVQNARKACELSDWEIHNPIGTLAAAYAENSDFDEAVKWQEKAIELAPAEAKYRSRLELYESGKPYRDEPKK